MVLRGLDLEIAAGETLALVGRSGAGKSTLLKLINGLIVPDRGQVIVEGRDTREWNPFELRRRIGYVLQEIGLFPHMTVAANVAVVPKLLGWEPARIDARVAEMLSARRTAARDLRARGRRWSSPAGSASASASRARSRRIRRSCSWTSRSARSIRSRAPNCTASSAASRRSVRKTVVIVTHDMAEAFALADRVGVLDDGVIAQLDAPRELARSTDPRVRPLLEPLLEARAFMS